ncbi:MAG TPA: aminotransferase class III-fold pyridoxal phosphate-dependent enzyme, partial [Pirellulales bacterium]|nr:aminotransferase class III-fold pyridoxal phosphate-dependent enzyme [Pirellulales bacterium]
FGGNPVSCRASLATFDLIEREFMANAVERGGELKAGLEQLTQTIPTLSVARGLGLMLAVDVVGPKGPDHQRRNAIVDAAFERGLLLLGCGKSAVRFCPALCVTSEQVTVGLDLFAAACRDISN